MEIEVQKVEYAQVEPLRALYRQEMNCQIIYDSILRRGMGDPYLIRLDGRLAGYGGVWNTLDPGRLFEFYTLPEMRAQALPLAQALIGAAGVTEIEAQTNDPLMMLVLCDCGRDLVAEAVLFSDAVTTGLPCPAGTLRPARPDDGELDNNAPWVIESEGQVVACGGFLVHYNPPYGDIFMSVTEAARRRGYGAYLVQELKRICYAAGRRPAARCNADNLASRRTLEKAGLLPCGRLLVARAVAP